MKTRVAVLGPKGTFTETAAMRMFRNPTIVYKDDVDGVFKYANSGKGTGVVAIENSLEGSVSKTLEGLMRYNIRINRETTLNINLCLIKKKKTGEIKLILSHPHALAQCKKYLRRKYPKAKLHATDSTTAAMQELSRIQNAAAVGPKEAAKRYGLEVMEENIQDDVSKTRFIAISRKESWGGKTSIIYAVKDKPGALYSTLRIFSENDINLTKIESRPSRRKLGEYIFYVDFENNGLSRKQVGVILEKVRRNTTFLKNLGSY